MAILTVNNITKRFGGLVAVKDFNLTIEEGELIGLIGPNGAGKTTAFNMISGVYNPTSGSIELSGKEITHLRPDQISKMGLTRTFQVVKPFPQISVLENVKVGAYNHTNDTKAALEISKEVLDYLGMWGIRGRLAGSLPIASRKMLELARALATRPRVLLLDEVMGGLRPTETNEMIQLVDSLRGKGLTILMVEHVMKVIMSLADRVVVMHHGEKLAEGLPSEITKNKQVIDAYLGEATKNANR